MFSFHKILNFFNNIIINLNKNELIIKNYIKLQSFKQSYYVNLLHVVLTNNYINLNVLLTYADLPFIFSTKNIKTQTIILTIINNKLNTNNYLFLTKIIIILKTYYQITITELLS